jgi:hypothetical protein
LLSLKRDVMGSTYRRQHILFGAFLPAKYLQRVTNWREYRSKPPSSGRNGSA